MKGHTFKITLDLIEEVLPGLDVYLRFTLAREKLSQGAETTRGFFIERLDVLMKKPYEVWDRTPREVEIVEEPVAPPKIPPRIRRSATLGKQNDASEKSEKKDEVESSDSRVSAPEVDDTKCSTSVQTEGKLKPDVPPKPEHLVALVRSRSMTNTRSGYYNQARMKAPESDHDGEEKTDGEEITDVTSSEDKVKVDDGDGDGGYEPVGQSDREICAVLDSNANIDTGPNLEKDLSEILGQDDVELLPPGRKLSSVSVLSEDSALGFNLDIPKIDSKSIENLEEMNLLIIDETPTLKSEILVETVNVGGGDLPPELPKRPHFLTVAKSKKDTPSLPSSPGIRGSTPSPVPSRSPNRLAKEDAPPPPLPPRKKFGPHVNDSQPDTPPSERNTVVPPPLPPLPPRPNEGPAAHREEEVDDSFAAQQRLISKSNIVEEEEEEEEGDYDTIDKSDGEEGGKTSRKERKKDIREEDSDGTSYESYEDPEDQRDVNSSQENILDNIASKENLHSSPYSLTFPRFRSFRKSKRKGHNKSKGSMDNVSLNQQTPAIFSGEMQYKAKFQWARRFCIITMEEFLCYKTARDSHPVLTFALKDFDVAYIEKEGKKYHIIRLSHPGFDTHLFSVNSRERADMWIEQFNQVGKFLTENRLSVGSLDGIKSEEFPSTPSKRHNASLSNISQTSSASDSADTLSFSASPFPSGSQYSMASTVLGSKESISPAHKTKRPLSTPARHDIIKSAISLTPGTPSDSTPSPSQRRHSAQHLPKSRITSQLFSNWGKRRARRSTPPGGAEPSAPMNFEVYEGSTYDVTVSGYMNVKSKFSSSSEWSKKYCRIKNGFFECYKDITDYRHEFNFPLVGCEIVTAREANHDLAIKIVQGDIDKVFIEPSNTLDQGRWLAVLIKETTCFSQPPQGSDDEDESNEIPQMVLSPSNDNLDEKVFFEDVVSVGDSDASDGYEQQAIQRNSFRDSMYDELKESDSENGYIENYGPEVQNARKAMSPESIKSLDDGYQKIKDDRLKSDSDIIIRPKSILDMYAKVDKRNSKLSAVMAMEESASKRSSVASEYSDILSAVLKVSKQYTEKHQPIGFGRSMSFDTGTSLKAAADKLRDFDAVAAKEYESFQELINSRAGSSEREVPSNSGSNSIESDILISGKDDAAVICPADSSNDGATIESNLTVAAVTVASSPGKLKKKSRHPQSQVLYPEISHSFGSLDEISSDSSSDDEVSAPKMLPNLNEELDKMSDKMSDRKKDSGICGDSSESISALIKEEGVRARNDSRLRADDALKHDPEKRKSEASIDKGLAGTFVNTPTSVYAKEVPVNVDDSDKNSSPSAADDTDHEYDDIDEKKRHSCSKVEGATGGDDKKEEQEDENLYDEIDKETEGQSSKVAGDGEEAGSPEHHDYADVDDKKVGIVEEEEKDSEHEYDPIEFQGAPPADDDRVSSESEYEEYEDHEEESIEKKQERATLLHSEVRIKKRDWAQMKKLRLALENQRMQSRDAEEKRKLNDEISDLEEKVKTMEAELAVKIEEHRALASEVTAYFQSHGLLGRKLSMISVESLMLVGK